MTEVRKPGRIFTKEEHDQIVIALCQDFCDKWVNYPAASTWSSYNRVGIAIELSQDFEFALRIIDKMFQGYVGKHQTQIKVGFAYDLWGRGVETVGQALQSCIHQSFKASATWSENILSIRNKAIELIKEAEHKFAGPSLHDATDEIPTVFLKRSQEKG